MSLCPACNSTFDDSISFCPKDGAQVVPEETAPAEDMAGQVIDERYRIVRKLGEGGMGEVYEARHVYIEKRVAIKLLRKEILANHEAVVRFHQEARSASSIGHPNIIAIEDFGRLPDGRVYLAMEFLDGAPLDQLMKSALPMGRALDIFAQVCQGLAAAHAKGIVHRDMKPENVYVTRSPLNPGRDLVKILDFGIAKVTAGEGNEHLTRTGTIFGTPFYMSPEQALGRPLDHRSDIYSVGVILYELMTGGVPFKAETFMGILTQHVTTQAVPPRQAAPDRGIPVDVEAIILRAMAKEPEARYQTMGEMLAAVHAVLTAAGLPVASPLSAPMPAVTLLPGTAGPAPMSALFPASPPAPTSQPGPASPAMPVVQESASSKPPSGITGWPTVAPPPEAARRRGPVWVAAGVLAVAAAGVVIGLMRHGRSARAEPGAAQAAATPALAASAPPKVEVIDYTVGSEPDGAEIRDDHDKLLGQTPDTIRLPSDRSEWVTIRLKGYEEARALLSPANDARVIITLRRPSAPERHPQVSHHGVSAQPNANPLDDRVNDTTDTTQLHAY